MFLSLGLRNAWLNKGRTVLGIVSMAIAAIVFTQSTTLSLGYPATAYFEARQLTGSDIVLLPGKIRLSQEDLSSPDTTWRFGKAGLDSPDPLLGLDKERFSYGGLEGVVPQDRKVNSSRMRKVAVELSSRPEVKAARVGHAMPVLFEVKSQDSTRLVYGYLEARDVAADLDFWRMEDTVKTGRYLRADDEDSPVGVVTTGWAGISVPAGSTLALDVPRMNTGDDGVKYRDYENSKTVLLQVVGTAGFRQGGLDSQVGHTYANPSIFVSQAFFDRVASSANCTPCDTAWGVSVTLNEISALEDFVSMIQRDYPDFTVISIPRMALAAAGGSVPSGVPIDMKQVTQVLAFLTASLLSATNLSVLMLSRKQEIGILRSIGATRWNIAVMVITESVCISLMGAILGNLIVQPAVLLNLLTNRVGADTVMATSLANVKVSIAFSVLTAVLFGFLPLTKALRVTPAAVLRGE